MGFTFRVATEDDQPGMMQLLREHSGWGDNMHPKAREWMRRAPHGELIATIAVDEKSSEIVGMVFFLPMPVSAAGREIPAVRSFGAVMARGKRRILMPRNHPMRQLRKRGPELIRDLGYAFVFSLPDPRWRRVVMRNGTASTMKTNEFEIAVETMGSAASRRKLAKPTKTGGVSAS